MKPISFLALVDRVLGIASLVIGLGHFMAAVGWVDWIKPEGHLFTAALCWFSFRFLWSHHSPNAAPSASSEEKK